MRFYISVITTYLMIMNFGQLHAKLQEYMYVQLVNASTLKF